MIGIDLCIMFLMCIFFAILHIWFILFLSTFMKSGVSRRSITILLYISFFDFLHQYFTLDENNSSEVVKHIFSFVPLLCFELQLMAMYGEAMNSQLPFPWAMDRINRDNVYLPLYGLLWLIADSVLYILLFLLTNLTMA
jgi:hypothetical protein